MYIILNPLHKFQGYFSRLRTTLLEVRSSDGYCSLGSNLFEFAVILNKISFEIHGASFRLHFYK